jgi:hypothetical protein
MRNPKYKEYIKDSPTPGDEYCMTGNYLNFLEEEYDEKVAETDKILASDELLPPGSAVSTNRPEDGILEVIEVVKCLSWPDDYLSEYMCQECSSGCSGCINGWHTDGLHQDVFTLGKNGNLYLVQTRIIERVDEE